ncbi:MAG: aryl-sulfate sulfotransferase [Promethearchaeota archaeon]
MQKKLNLKGKITVFFILFIPLGNIFLYVFFINANLFKTFGDVDRRENGNTFMCTGSTTDLQNFAKSLKYQIPINPEELDHKIIEVNQKGKIVWEFEEVAYPHEVVELPNHNLLIADTGFDRVIEINYPEKDIVWEWDASKINWTKVNSEWGPDHFYNNPTDFAWTHLNHIAYKEYDTWEACLISLHHFDLIVEINYTAERAGDEHNPDNIVWYYGNYNDHSLLNRQHNPDYLKNGNIIVADSENDRILEIDYEKKEVVWKYKGNLDWPRDADELENGNILITDSFNDRVIEINKETKEIVWEFEKDLIIPYEADELDNGHILISNGFGGTVLEVDRNGKIVWKYGASLIRTVFYLNLITLISIQGIGIIFMVKYFKSENTTPKGKKIRIILIGVCFFFLFFEILIFFSYNSIISHFANIIMTQTMNFMT